MCSKKKANRNRTGPMDPGPVIQASPTHLTADQNKQIEALADNDSSLEEKYGKPDEEVMGEPLSGTLEDGLKRVKHLLNTARAQYDRSENLSASAEQRDKAVRASEAELNSRIKAIEVKEKVVLENEVGLQARESGLIDQATQLVARELNAENGFLIEKTRILHPLAEEVKKLQEERDRLTEEISNISKVAVDERQKILAKRFEQEATDRAEASMQETEVKIKFDAEVAKLRNDKLAELRTELNAERERHELVWAKEIESRLAEIIEREQDVSAKERRTSQERRILLADQEMHADDIEVMRLRVERLVEEGTEKLRHHAETSDKLLKDARESRDQHAARLKTYKEWERQFGNRTPENILADLKKLESERDDLAQQLRERPGTGAADRLVELERERSAWLEEQAVLYGDLAKTKAELNLFHIGAIELETLGSQKKALEVHKDLLDGAVNELRARVDELTSQDDRRNPMTALTSLDDLPEHQQSARTTDLIRASTPTLSAFAEDLKHRIAKGVPGRTLYYSDRDIRAFLGGLAMGRLILLQGISGTGKTSLPLAFAEAIGGGVETVYVQAGWRDRQDLIGYYNAFHHKYYATNFLQALYKAGMPEYRDRIFMMILDEINLSKPEHFFADFLAALEQPMGNRRITLVDEPILNAPTLMVEGRHLPIPPNVWFVGTANHDETTAEFADKTYDRAHVMEMPRKTSAAHFDILNKPSRPSISFAKLEHAFSTAADTRASEVQHAITWLNGATFSKTLGDHFGVGWGNRLEGHMARFLPVVVETGGSVGEAMDHLLVTKVFRKLKDRHEFRVASLEKLKDQLLTSWDGLDRANLPDLCFSLIEREILKKQGEEQV